MRGYAVCITAAVGIGLSSLAAAQSTFDLPRGEFVKHRIESGVFDNAAAQSKVVFVTVVRNEGALWTRVYFEDYGLDAGSRVRMTSLLDGEVQELDAAGLRMWSNASAYFNGDSVLLELIAAPKSRGNMLRIEQVAIEPLEQAWPIGSCGICGGDSRVPSDEDWAGRLMPVGCSASIYNTQSCVVSAGHCMGSANVMQFRVPNSTPGCNTQNPPIADQFPVTGILFQNSGVGGDWAALTTGTNNLGQTAYQRFGEYRPIATSVAPVGANVDVWGYGQSSNCTLSSTQQRSQGTINQVTSNTYRALIDVTYGNSGSALIWNGQIIGVVTHCDTCGSGNIMNRIDAPAFVSARESLCPNPPDNDTCAGTIVLGEGSTPFANVGATTSGPDEPGLCDFDGDSNIQSDVWFGYVATCTGTLTISLCDGNQPQPGGSCAGNCGGQSPDGCWCDNACADQGDCCLGVCDDCPDLTHCGPQPGACAGNCGGQSPDGCWCDNACAGKGDCCPGVCDDCPDLTHCAPQEGPCAGNCGGQAPEGCWCDNFCDGKGDCCPGVCTDCPDLSHCLSGGAGGAASGGAATGGFDTKMAIYGESCPTSSGTVIACNKDECGLLSSITIPVTAGEAFRIRIGGHNGAQGNGIVTITCEPGQPVCVGDLNNDGVVNVSDLLALLSAWGDCPGCDADFNGDGVVNVSDMLALLAAWGDCP